MASVIQAVRRVMSWSELAFKILPFYAEGQMGEEQYIAAL